MTPNEARKLAEEAQEAELPMEIENALTNIHLAIEGAARFGEIQLEYKDVEGKVRKAVHDNLRMMGYEVLFTAGGLLIKWA